MANGPVPDARSSAASAISLGYTASLGTPSAGASSGVASGSTSSSGGCASVISRARTGVQVGDARRGQAGSVLEHLAERLHVRTQLKGGRGPRRAQFELVGARRTGDVAVPHR